MLVILRTLKAFCEQKPWWFWLYLKIVENTSEFLSSQINTQTLNFKQGGRVFIHYFFQILTENWQKSKIILKIQNLAVPCCHSEVNIDDTEPIRGCKIGCAAGAAMAG